MTRSVVHTGVVLVAAATTGATVAAAAGTPVAEERATPPAAVMKTLATFSGKNGSEPQASLLLATDGNYYGTTLEGGKKNDGTIFRMTPAGAITVLHSFAGNDGSEPMAALMQASDGSLYGSTSGGGKQGRVWGTLFRITLAGTFTSLYSFDGTDGANPQGALIQASDGALYGTTFTGGGPDASGGVFFRLGLDGNVQILASFAKSDETMPNGGYPTGPLLLTGDGTFVGTATAGGAHDAGTLFRVTTAGVITDVHDFNVADGSGPSGGLAPDAAHAAWYGATLTGGAHNDGTYFRLAGATFTTLHVFDNTKDGGAPTALVLGSDQKTFYGALAASKKGVGAIVSFDPSSFAVTTLATIKSGQFSAPLTNSPQGGLIGTNFNSGKSGDGQIFELSGF
jgi:uncharacterized repeat protein (TIGR03803 family)